MYERVNIFHYNMSLICKYYGVWLQSSHFKCCMCTKVAVWMLVQEATGLLTIMVVMVMVVT